MPLPTPPPPRHCHCCVAFQCVLCYVLCWSRIWLRKLHGDVKSAGGQATSCSIWSLSMVELGEGGWVTKGRWTMVLCREHRRRTPVCIGAATARNLWTMAARTWGQNDQAWASVVSLNRTSPRTHRMKQHGRTFARDTAGKPGRACEPTETVIKLSSKQSN